MYNTSVIEQTKWGFHAGHRGISPCGHSLAAQNNRRCRDIIIDPQRSLTLIHNKTSASIFMTLPPYTLSNEDIF